MKCFLSCSFRDKDKRVVDWFLSFLNAFPDIEVIEARNRPSAPSNQVEQGIKEADLFCAVVTPREEGIPPWILNEVGMARNENKIIMAFVEDGLPISALGIFPSITEFKRFRRNSLGREAPEYVKYISNARREVLRRKGLDRSTLIKTVNTLQSLLEIVELQRSRIDDL